MPNNNTKSEKSLSESQYTFCVIASEQIFIIALVSQTRFSMTESLSSYDNLFKVSPLLNIITD